MPYCNRQHPWRVPRRKKSLSCRVGSINYIGAGGGALDSVRNIFDLRNLASQPIGKPVLLKRTQCHQRKLQGNDKAGSWCEVASSSRTPRVSNAQAPSRCLSELGRSAPLE